MGKCSTLGGAQLTFSAKWHEIYGSLADMLGKQFTGAQFNWICHQFDNLSAASLPTITHIVIVNLVTLGLEVQIRIKYVA